MDRPVTDSPLKTFFDLVKIEHSIFALPFAYVGAFLAAGGVPSIGQLLWITLAMVSARTAGMSLNRLIDEKFDAKNPRTAARPLPRGLISRRQVWALTIVSLALLVISAALLNPLCLALSPLAVGLLFLYSYLKRYTAWTHVGLGLVQACAPIGAWLAIKPQLSAPPLLLGAAILFWIGGFDILYALQDVEFDRNEGLFSIPSRLGIVPALALSALFHGATIGALLGAGMALNRGPIYLLGMGAIALILLVEHCIVTPRNLTRINLAFFTLNGWVGVIFLASVTADLFLHG